MTERGKLGNGHAEKHRVRLNGFSNYVSRGSRLNDN